MEAELASSEGEIIAIVIVITSPSPLHDFLKEQVCDQRGTG